ncbi:hypothetical protein [Mucilaginibacter celer]|uniref:Uncharacterized protein n=1 Tax=Mucilaginibacter celer TaxID=2305508 RepID=A0A494VZG0_9SPHI|nr:hypothetical protein [Mucilaginibacter celer]AYL96535.1 hypothetical protein HYN43_015050 [Mucilaginibacter celer]
MANETKKNPTEKDQSPDLEFLLRTNGYLFPETINEVSEYEKRFGDTDIILPDDMREPTFLEKALSKVQGNKLTAIKNKDDNFAIAARLEKGTELPERIKKKMDEDRNKSEK